MIGQVLQGTAVRLGASVAAAGGPSVDGPTMIGVAVVLLAAGGVGGYLLRRRSMR